MAFICLSENMLEFCTRQSRGTHQQPSTHICQQRPGGHSGECWQGRDTESTLGQAPGCGSRMQSHSTITITDLITTVNINTASSNLPSSLVRDHPDHNKILVTSSWCWHVLTSWSGSSSFVALNNDQGAITINYTDTRHRAHHASVDSSTR